MQSRRYISYVFIFSLYLFVEGFCYLSLLLLESVFYIPYDPNVSALSEKQKTSLENFLKRQEGEHVAQDAVLGWVYVAKSLSENLKTRPR